MKYNIHSDIESLALEIDSLIPWELNPHKGDIPAIMASYQEFGQVKPIVVKINGDGTYKIIAGNHQTEAAKRLGWTHIAATRLDTDDKRAIAYALADNRTTELGSDDPVLLHEAIISVADEYPEVFDALGWDNFQLAAMDEHNDYLAELDSSPSGYIAPVLISQPGDPIPQINVSPPVMAPSGQEPERMVAPASMDQHEAITRGSPSVGAAGAKAVVQYMLVFDTADQQRRWYDFLRWLRSDAGTEGETTAERLLYFLDSHADF
jgi:hypothetical protein